MLLPTILSQHWIQGYLISTVDSTVPLYEGLSLGSTVSGLTPYSLYEFVVSACTKVGCLSTAVTAVTLPAPPGEQLPPNITARGPTALDVSWQPPTRPNGNYNAGRVQR